MNDLELISVFRSEMEEPGEVDTALARVVLMDAIAGEHVPGAPARRRRSRRGWWLPASAVAVTVALLLVVSASLTGRNDGTTQTALAAVLHRVAEAAAARQTPVLRAGQYIYTRSVSLEASSTYDLGANHKQYFTVMLPTVRQTWFAANGSGLMVEWSGKPTFPTAHDRQVWIAAGRPPLGGNNFDRERFQPGSTLDLTGLPTDPARLRKLIEERHIEGGPKGNDETFTIIGDMLRETYAPPKLRAALFQIAAGLPNVHLFGHTTWTRRPGIAIGYISAGSRNELVFDPHTSALLGERTVTIKTGAVTGQVIYEASGIVGSTRAKASTAP